MSPREHRNGALQPGVDVGVAARVVARLAERGAEVLDEHVG